MLAIKKNPVIYQWDYNVGGTIMLVILYQKKLV